MKKFFRAMICAALAAALAPACTGNLGEGEETEPVFPEKTKVTILPDGTVNIPFHANMDWTASIPDDDPEVTSYFILEDGAMTSYSVRGRQEMPASQSGASLKRPTSEDTAWKFP